MALQRKEITVVVIYYFPALSIVIFQTVLNNICLSCFVLILSYGKMLLTSRIKCWTNLQPCPIFCLLRRSISLRSSCIWHCTVEKLSLTFWLISSLAVWHCFGNFITQLHEDHTSKRSFEISSAWNLIFIIGSVMNALALSYPACWFWKYFTKFYWSSFIKPYI